MLIMKVKGKLVHREFILKRYFSNSGPHMAINKNNISQNLQCFFYIMTGMPQRKVIYQIVMNFVA